MIGRMSRDVFLDLESDPFVGEHGLEYLFGYVFKDVHGAFVYEGDWAFTRVDEKRAIEKFVEVCGNRHRRAAKGLGRRRHPNSCLNQPYPLRACQW